MTNYNERLDEIVDTLNQFAPDQLVEEMRAQAKQAIKALIAKAVVEARIELYNLYGEPRCENLHHPKKWQHKALEDCPVVQAIEQLNTDKEVVWRQ